MSNAPRKFYRPPPFKIKLEGTENAVIKSLKWLRSRDITALKKKYPRHIKVQSEEGNDGEEIIRCVFEPSDPDWPFDVKKLPLTLNFPLDYPKSPPDVRICADNMDFELPDPLRKHVDNSIREWILIRTEKNVSINMAEMILRPFWKWLDKNLQVLFVEGLKRTRLCIQAEASGISLVRGKNNTNTTNVCEKEEQNGNGNVEDLIDIKQLKIEREIEEENGNSEVAAASSTPPTENVVLKSGPKLKIQVTMGENVGLLEYSYVALLVRCPRCRTNAMWISNDGGHCNQCRTIFTANFRSSFVHAGNDILGVIEGANFQPLDMVLTQSKLSATCLPCNNIIQITGIAYGSECKIWCNTCHAVLTITIQSIRFSGNVMDNVDSTKIKVNPHKTKVLDPVLVKGKPLPDKGTCAHYKKSFRWFRFPCCGKVYACDICHETNEDHEMTFANRVLCGHCSTEQPYSSGKPCTHCNGNMTRLRTAHWEGGKGCRDVKKMAKTESRKYTGLNKTISKHKSHNEKQNK